MDNEKLEKFGELFVKEVRDNTIEMFQKMVNGNLKGLTAQTVQNKLVIFDEQQKDIILWLISKVIDQSMYNMMFLVEEYEEIDITYEGENINEMSDGLSGELYTEDGWIQKFSSKEYDE